MKILVCDTETTDLFRPNQRDPPYIVQLSFVIYDMTQSKITRQYNEIIHLEDPSVLTEEATKIHRINRHMVKQSNVKIKDALQKFWLYADQVELLVGHNIGFDCKMIREESLRNNVEFKEFPQTFCTMKQSVDLCRIQNSWGTYKWPKLIELYLFFFEKRPTFALHDAMNDVHACLQCFLKLSTIKYIPVLHDKR